MGRDFRGAGRAQLIIQNNRIWVKLNSCVYKLFPWVFWLMMSPFTENHVTTCPGMNIPGLTSGSINNWLEGFIWITGPLCGSPSSQGVRVPVFQRARSRAALMGCGQCFRPTKHIVGTQELGILLTESYYYTCFFNWETKLPSLTMSEVGLEPLPLEPGPLSLSLPNKYSTRSNWDWSISGYWPFC